MAVLSVYYSPEYSYFRHIVIRINSTATLIRLATRSWRSILSSSSKRFPRTGNSSETTSLYFVGFIFRVLSFSAADFCSGIDFSARARAAFTGFYTFYLWKQMIWNGGFYAKKHFPWTISLAEVCFGKFSLFCSWKSLSHFSLSAAKAAHFEFFFRGDLDTGSTGWFSFDNRFLRSGSGDSPRSAESMDLMFCANRASFSLLAMAAASGFFFGLFSAARRGFRFAETFVSNSWTKKCIIIKQFILFKSKSIARQTWIIGVSVFLFSLLSFQAQHTRKFRFRHFSFVYLKNERSNKK